LVLGELQELLREHRVDAHAAPVERHARKQDEVSVGVGLHAAREDAQARAGWRHRTASRPPTQEKQDGVQRPR